MDDKPKPPRRQAVLILSHPDGYIEVYGERNIDVRIQRIPEAGTRPYEVTAEAIAEMMLPKRYRELWRDDYLRVNGTTRPLAAESLQRVFATMDSIHALNAVKEPAKVNAA